MDYRSEEFIDKQGKEAGFEVNDDRGQISLGNEQEIIEAIISDNKVEIKTQGDLRAILERKGQTAKLPARCVGKLIIGDIVWLVNNDAQEDFWAGKRENLKGAGVKIEIIPEKIIENREIFVNENKSFLEKRNPTVNIILGGVVLLLLVAGTILGYQKRTSNEQSKKFEEIRAVFDKNKNEIESTRTLNIDTALELAKKTEELLNNPGGAEIKYGKELESMKSEIGQIKQSLGGGEGIEYEVAYDTSLIREGAGFEKMSIREGIIYLLSPSLGRIDAVNISLKSTENIITDEKIKLWTGIFYSGDKWYGSGLKTLTEIKRKDISESEIENVDQAVEMSGWNGLIYVIDNDKSIKKISNNSASLWLKNDSKLEEDGASLAIDSSIWVLGKSGKIYHYNRGEKDNFEMSFLPVVASVKSLRTSDKVEFLAYIIDDKTVIIYGKDGKILAKYNFGDTKIKDMVVENQNKAVLVLAENGKIYRIKIK